MADEQAPVQADAAPQLPERYCVNVPLRWSDMDAYGHVNNVQFLRLLEDARVIGFEEWFGQDRSVLAEGILVARHEIEYLAPLLFRVPPIVVQMWATKIGGAGFDLAYEVRDGLASDDTVYARAETTLVLYDFATSTPRRMAPDLKALLEVHSGEPVPFRSAAALMDLHFPDAQGLDDLRTYVARAKAADDDGAIRFQASGTTLAAYVGVLPGSGLMGEGAVIGLRVMPLAEAVEVDTTVSLASVTDRLARGDGRTLSLPPTTVSVGWAAMAPPRSGWERVGSVTADEVYAVAREGISQVASGAPADAGGQAVAALRRHVWGRLTTTTPPVPAGGAFAAYALGFAAPGSDVTVWTHGRWTRLSTTAGHVLIRGGVPA